MHKNLPEIKCIPGVTQAPIRSGSISNVGDADDRVRFWKKTAPSNKIQYITLASKTENFNSIISGQGVVIGEPPKVRKEHLFK